METGKGTTRMPASRRRTLRGERGAASWVTVLILVGLAAGCYLAVVFLPPAVLHYEVKQVVRDYGNQAIKNPNDEELIQKMLHKIRALQSVEMIDGAGRTVRVPVIDIRRDEVVWERSTEPPTLHVAFEYPRTIDYPFLDRSIERVYRVDLTMDQARADWGPSR
ncbi:MAG: hypothetical protein H6Q88_2119 [Anaeromyxobacteraceae bacterium]|nr:hypothetical protein [Anaeromyxobacteraceae bacterium]